MPMSSFSGETSLILGPALCAGQHSQLEQERQYLHQALVAERGRKEWLLGALKKAEAELVPTDQSTPLADTSGPCRHKRPLQEGDELPLKVEQLCPNRAVSLRQSSECAFTNAKTGAGSVAPLSKLHPAKPICGGKSPRGSQLACGDV